MSGLDGQMDYWELILMPPEPGNHVLENPYRMANRSAPGTTAAQGPAGGVGTGGNRAALAHGQYLVVVAAYGVVRSLVVPAL